MNVLQLLDELRVIGHNGLEYAEDPYDEQRYERLLELASQSYEEIGEVPATEVRERFDREVGYVTPKVGADAGIFDEDGRALLMRRADDDTWCLPCGWVDPNESPAEAAVRETREETGLSVRTVELVDVFHTPAGASSPHGRVSILYRCAVEGGTLELSHEGEELAYRDIDAVEEWHQRHETFARAAKRAWERQ